MAPGWTLGARLPKPPPKRPSPTILSKYRTIGRNYLSTHSPTQTRTLLNSFPQTAIGAPTPLTQTDWGPGLGDGGGSSGGALGADPSVLMALNMQTTGNAQIDAMLKALRERAIIAFGDPAITGVGFDLDPATKAQTQANYDSGNATLARLVHGNDLARQGIINSEAAHGMLHSGDLGYRETEQGRAYGNQTYDARQSLIDYLTKASQDALDRRNALQMAVNNAYLNAYANGYGGGGGGGGYGGRPGGLENPDQFNITGYSGEDIAAAAAKYASGRSYNGSAYQPGMVMQEGHVEVRNGVPGVYIKYRTANGDSTEWTPIGPPSSGGGGNGGGGGGGTPTPAPAPAPTPTPHPTSGPSPFPNIKTIFGVGQL